ncbi:uncharacterized protein LTR77_004003 [Saxophila tyrrhenica]|uniref:ASST-domain-containing protein n=1 Tax=Saxophila tyrrhenica TaxID=1690608 RepID=A0AAV9PIR3_9PEZI|nr:hypothetical protein LTR77_004003 [Saxophila tyrrhenica]
MYASNLLLSQTLAGELAERTLACFIYNSKPVIQTVQEHVRDPIFDEMILRWPTAALALAATVMASEGQPGMMRLVASDLTFVSRKRPDLRPPRYNVTTYKPESLNSGYWFVAPYADLGAQSGSASLCQIGPHIYDNRGDLVWSGACDVKNRNTFDFRTWDEDGEHGFSSFVEGQPTGLDMWHNRGGGLIWDDNYTVMDSVEPTGEGPNYNFHEFTRLGDGGALVLYDGSSNFTDPETSENVLVWDGGFLELDSTGSIAFRWRVLDNIHVSESTEIRPEEETSTEWDWFHINSVDRDSDGNYLLSGRHTDSIYKISCKDRSIIWRLGGLRSSLAMDGFNFSRQHHARFMDENSGKTLISFLNNAADSHHETSATSAAYLVQVNENENMASLVKQWPRPDGKLGFYRGNVQLLDNGNVFVHWGDNGYTTEFDSEGNVLQEAHLVPSHLGTYRAYKFDFKATPSEPVAIRCSYAAAEKENNVTVCHVSWNGATEFAFWELFASDETAEPLVRGARTGFETVLVANGLHGSVYACAIAANTTTLGTSQPYHLDRTENSQPTTSTMAHAVQSPSQVDAQISWPSSSESQDWHSSAIFMIGVVFGLLLMNMGARYGPMIAGFRGRAR